MERTTGFEVDGSRYAYDGGACSPSKGWAQIDTTEDAWYYGNWSNPAALRTFSYTEGDTTLSECATDEEFRELMRRFENMGTFKGVDDMCSDEIRDAFARLGLADLLHQNRPRVAS